MRVLYNKCKFIELHTLVERVVLSQNEEGYTPQISSNYMVSTTDYASVLIKLRQILNTKITGQDSL